MVYHPYFPNFPGKTGNWGYEYQSVSNGMQVRCRSCGNSILVLNPAEITSGMSVLNQVAASRDHSDKRSTEPAASLPKKEHVHAPLVLYPSFPKSPAKIRRRRTFKWSFLIPFVCLILLLFGGSVSLAFTQVGKRVLAGIGQELADAITFFRT